MKSSTETNVPELRFPEFEGEWKISNLGKSSNMKAGNFVPAKKIKDIETEYNYPCYGGNGLRGYTKSFTHVGKFSLIGRQGALCGNVKLVEGKFHATEHAVVVKHEKDIDTDFLFYTLKILKLNRYATGQAQPGLSISNIESVKFSFPQLPEQQKIADFLSQVDRKIDLLQQKVSALEQYKKGVMQQLFSQQLRFKDDDGNDFLEWEEKKLGEIGVFKTSSVDKKSKNDQNEVFLINYMDVYKHKTINNENINSFQVVTANVTQIKSSNIKKGDILFTPSSETPSDIGHSVVIFENIENAVFSYHLIRFRPNIKLNLLYSHYFCNIPKVLKQISKFATGSTRFTISSKNFSNITVDLPCFEEQIKIANFLSSIDQKIAHTQEQLEQTQNFKKGLLQKMFV
ncbi:restriction endonuclease subunit S [Psychroflexus planctonicus]|uniref:Type I site-specific deoxyribonuclease specificity subunit n=1 Tax=Psychroflexus planctonicus TaxID=1526575 RepID=A0ABQ1SML4_9FLAO|nr:restriction endonuclease subunit S [Psychroflexus planctonicus]GGE43021.1 type I site-specific deoxyribonuclease specificity subunit [Psychroflexus planctonicus]